MFNVIVFNNVLVTDTQQPLPDFESMEGVQSVKTFEEIGLVLTQDGVPT